MNLLLPTPTCADAAFNTPNSAEPLNSATAAVIATSFPPSIAVFNFSPAAARRSENSIAFELLLDREALAISAKKYPMYPPGALKSMPALAVVDESTDGAISRFKV